MFGILWHADRCCSPVSPLLLGFERAKGSRLSDVLYCRLLHEIDDWLTRSLKSCRVTGNNTSSSFLLCPDSSSSQIAVTWCLGVPSLFMDLQIRDLELLAFHNKAEKATKP